MVARDRQSTVISLGARAIFVLGNGPSLACVNLAALSPYASIGMNAAYRYWSRIGWRPTYYACLDLVVGLSHIEGIRTLIREGRDAAEGHQQIRKFLLRSNLIDALGPDADDLRVVNFDALRLRELLLQVDPITTGSHATLWARSEGFDPIVILGVDGRYTEVVAGAEYREGTVLEIAQKRENPNYFFEDYQQPGDRFNVPNPRPDMHLNAWRNAAVALARAGATVANGNPTSEVRVFPFVDLDQLLKGGDAILQPSDERPAPVGQMAQPRTLAGIAGFVGRALTDPRLAALAAVASVVAAIAATVAWSIGATGTAILLIAAMCGAILSLQVFLIGLVLRRTTRFSALKSQIGSNDELLLTVRELDRYIRARDREGDKR